MRAENRPVPAAQRLAVGARSWWLFADGTVLPVVCGGDGPDDPPAPPAPTNPPAPDLAALQAVIDQAKTGGATEAQTNLLKALGFDTLADAQTFITAKREADTAAMTELERREQAAADREAAAQQRETDAAKLIERGVIRNALQTAGVPLESLDDAEGLVKITGDVTDDTAKTAVEAVKAKPAFASLFTATAPPPAPGTPPPSGVPPTPPGNTPPATGADAGKARAAKVLASRQGATRDDLLRDFAPPTSNPLVPTA